MDSSRFARTFAGIFLLLMQLSFSCHAEQLEAPAGRIILTVSGAIAANNNAFSNANDNAAQQRVVSFDLPLLETLGVTRIATDTPWTTGTVEFEGVLVRDVLEFVKAQGQTLQAAALDDYIVKLPVEDFLEHDVIIATRIAGKPMRVRENGPLWIIYPWSDIPALRRPHYYSRSIWQLTSLLVLP